MYLVLYFCRIMRARPLQIRNSNDMSLSLLILVSANATCEIMSKLIRTIMTDHLHDHTAFHLVWLIINTDITLFNASFGIARVSHATLENRQKSLQEFSSLSNARNFDILCYTSDT